MRISVVGLVALAMSVVVAHAAAALPRTSPDPATWDADDEVGMLAVHGDRVYLGGDFFFMRQRVGTQSRFRTADGALKRGPEAGGVPTHAAGDGLGGYYLAGYNCGVRIWRVGADGQPVPGFAITQVGDKDIVTVFDMVLSRDRRTLFVAVELEFPSSTTMGEMLVVAFDAQTGAQTGWRPQARLPDVPRVIALSPDGTTLYVGALGARHRVSTRRIRRRAPPRRATPRRARPAGGSVGRRVRRAVLGPSRRAGERPRRPEVVRARASRTSAPDPYRDRAACANQRRRERRSGEPDVGAAHGATGSVTAAARHNGPP